MTQTKVLGKFAGIMLGVILIAAAVLPLIATTPLYAAATSYQDVDNRSKIRSCRRERGTRGECRSPSPTPSASN